MVWFTRKRRAYYTYGSYKIEEEINRSGMKVTNFFQRDNIDETLESLEIRGSKIKKNNNNLSLLTLTLCSWVSSVYGGWDSDKDPRIVCRRGSELLRGIFGFEIGDRVVFVEREHVTCFFLIRCDNRFLLRVSDKLIGPGLRIIN